MLFCQIALLNKEDKGGTSEMAKTGLSNTKAKPYNKRLSGLSNTPYYAW